MENEKIEEFFIKANANETFNEMQRLLLIQRTRQCANCFKSMKLSQYKNDVDGFIWRCLNTSCVGCRSRVSVRKNSAFDGLKIIFKKIIKIILRWSSDQQQFLFYKL
jgi:hypothetical protein